MSLPGLGIAARDDLNRCIRKAKTTYKRKVEDHFCIDNMQQVWWGLQHLTHFKSSSTTTAEGDAALAEELNYFYTCFEVERSDAAAALPLNHNSTSLTVQEHEVRCTLRTVNPRKAAGPE